AADPCQADQHEQQRRSHRGLPSPCGFAVSGWAFGGPCFLSSACTACFSTPSFFGASGGGRCVNPDEIPSTNAFLTTPRIVGQSWMSGLSRRPLIGTTVATAFRSGTRSENR